MAVLMRSLFTALIAAGMMMTLYLAVNIITTKKAPRPQPYNSIFFLKVYKTGSTTMYNMLARYAIAQDLHWACYQTRPYEVSDTSFTVNNFLKRVVPQFDPKQGKYEMIADHALYNKSHIEEVLKTPVRFITLIRHPVSHMQSYIKELKASGFFRFQDPFTQAYDLTKAGGRRFAHQDLLENPVAKQLGFPKLPSDGNRSEILTHMEHIKENFMVGLTEHFHTSMVIFRRSLGLSLKNIMFIILRKTLQAPQKPKEELDEAMLEKVCVLSPLDCQIYTYFEEEFKERVAEGGRDMLEETNAYKVALGKVSEYCTHILNTLRNISTPSEKSALWGTEPIHIGPTLWSSAFTVSAKECALMRMEERALGTYFYLRQNWSKCEVYRNTRRLRCPVYDDNIRYLSCPNLCKTSKNVSDLLDNIINDKGAYIWH